jgi:hypothetical protein
VRRAILVLAVALVAGLVEAGPEKVAFPDYQRFFIFGTVNNESARTIRIMYLSYDAIRLRERGKPLPYGTILVAEDRAGRLDASGVPLKDAEGRFVPTDKIVSVWVQEKQKGWGPSIRRPSAPGSGSSRPSCPTGPARPTRRSPSAGPATRSRRPGTTRSALTRSFRI